MNHLRRLTICLILVAIAATSYSQSKTKEKHELVFLVGTIQPFLLDGLNFEVDYYTPKMVFNYSHGYSLELTEELGTTVGELKNQNLAIHIPISTGFGIGYRLNKYFDIRIEPKYHEFEVYYDNTNRNLSTNQITDYSTITLGLGTYFRWKPFEKQDNLLKGIFTSTSIRFWPQIFSSLKDHKIQYYNTVNKKNEIHETSNIGIANTPIIFNISIGYAIQF